MRQKTVGKLLIEALKDALNTPGTGKVLNPEADIKTLRKRLKLSQAEFSERYHIKLKTLRHWEQGLRSPDSANLAYLTCIAKNPDAISNILNG